MSGWRPPKGGKNGGCLCGAVRFECRSIYDVIYCHCSKCCHWSGAPAVLSANVPGGDFSLIKGTPEAYRSSEQGLRHFCSACGTHLYFINDGPFVSINVLALNDSEDVRPRLHQCVASKLEWFTITDDLPQYPDSRIPAPGREP
ncbi:GFA family protein [Devosia sp. A8/3-2]|nr:GFA family protein [Devosia sp. A8/3-2]